jgi:SSS family transporter
LDWLVEHWLLAVLLVTYTAALLANAFIGKRSSQGLSDYYVGARKMGGIAIGVSFFATFASTNSYIGHAGKGYAYGLPWMLMAVFLVVFTYVSWRWIGPRVRRFASHWDALTIPDFLGSRFVGQTEGHERHLLRVAASVVIVFSSLLYLVAIFKGAGHLFERFLHVPYEVAVGITLVIVVLYTSLGGFISVVRTDILQGMLMLFGSVTIFYFVTQAAGGIGSISQLADRPETEFVFDWNGGIPFAVLVGIALSGSLKLIVDPRQVSRFYALKSDAAAKQGLWVAVIGLAIVQFCIFPVGIYAHLIMDGVTDTDIIVPTLVNDPSVFPLWAADFLIVAIMAAAMSSMDSVLLVAASTLYKNLVEPFHASKNPLLLTRLAVIGIAVVGAVVALDPPGDIVEITIFSGSLYAVCFFPAVVLGLYWTKGSAAAVLASMGLGVFTLLLWIGLDLRGILHEVFPALAVSMLAYLGVSWATSSTLDHLPD